MYRHVSRGAYLASIIVYIDDVGAMFSCVSDALYRTGDQPDTAFQKSRCRRSLGRDAYSDVVDSVVPAHRVPSLHGPSSQTSFGVVIPAEQDHIMPLPDDPVVAIRFV
jgi:hypothetical protein